MVDLVSELGTTVAKTRPLFVLCMFVCGEPKRFSELLVGNLMEIGVIETWRHNYYCVNLIIVLTKAFVEWM